MTLNTAERFKSLLDTQQLAHGYLFESRDGKAAYAELQSVAKVLLCHTKRVNFEACGSCKSCSLIDAGHHPDLTQMDNGDASIGIDEIRNVSQWMQKTAQLDHGQIAIINHAQLMTENAANALLKTLEEPTSQSYLFLLNDSGSALLPTITSRCQVVKLASHSKQDLKNLYPELPDYLLGFANGNKSMLQEIIEQDSTGLYEKTYQTFIAWLKNHASKATLKAHLKSDMNQQAFFIYLLERRVRQMLLKGFYKNANAALSELTHFNFAQSQIKGQNKELALAALIEKLDVLVK
jgi:DNA polymerase III subunit delta'